MPLLAERFTVQPELRRIDRAGSGRGLKFEKPAPRVPVQRAPKATVVQFSEHWGVLNNRHFNTATMSVNSDPGMREYAMGLSQQCWLPE